MEGRSLLGLCYGYSTPSYCVLLYRGSHGWGFVGVWQVLQALRAHDDRFNAVINQIELNDRKPQQIEVVGVSGDPGEDNLGADQKPVSQSTQLELNFPELEEWRDAIFAKIVQKCGDRRYWESWAKDVAKIAEGHVARIEALLHNSKHRETFEAFLTGLRQNLNPNVSAADAISKSSGFALFRNQNNRSYLQM